MYSLRRSYFRTMGFFLALATLATLSNPTQARPLVLEEQAKLTLPDTSFTCCGRVAISGNTLVVTGSKDGPPELGPGAVVQAAFVFERNAAGQWQFVTKLVEETHDLVGGVTPISVAIDGPVAAVALKRVHFFRRTASGWTSIPATATGGNSTDIEADAGRFLLSAGSCGYDAELIQEQTDGSYRDVQRFTGAPRDDHCDDEFLGADVDISSNRVVLGGPEVHVYTEAGGGWTGVRVPPSAAPTEFGEHVTIFNGTVLASAPQTQGGPYIFLPPYQQNSGNLTRPDALTAGRFGRIDLRDGLAVLTNYEPSSAPFSGSIAVFTSSDNQNFDYSAMMVASEASSIALGVGDVEIDAPSRTVVANSSGALYVFSVPNDLSQPAIIADNFEDGNASDWTPIAGSGFSVVSNGSTLVYRQSSLAGAGASSPTGMDWENQSIQADVTPTAFNGSDRWFGLTVRQTDVGNYYYITVRSTNTLQLRKLVDGAIVTLASTPLPVVLGRTYNLRLEAIGTWVRAFVNGNEVLSVRDTSHQSGRAGLYTYKTRADFDNVVVTPSPQLTLFKDDFDSRGTLDPAWQPQTGNWALANDSTAVLAQTSIAGGARAVVGIPTEDQILQVRAKPTSFTTTGERWFGLITRFVDDQNYYYITARNTNTISLRKLVNGVTTVLDTAPLSVTAGTWYDLRMETIGDSLRVYVNGRLTLEASDNSHPRGIYGMAAYKTAVRYDDVNVLEP